MKSVGERPTLTRGAADVAPRQAGRLSFRRTAFAVHAFLGLQLSLVLFFVCATGTLAVVSDEIEWLFWDVVRATPTQDPVSLGTQLATVQNVYPDHDVTYITAGEESYLATQFELIAPDGGLRYAYVDPATGVVNGDAGFITFRSVLRGLHYYLLLPGNWGFYPITALGLVLLTSVATGLLAYPRFWRRSLHLPRLDRGGRVFWGELHRLSGVWISAFVIVIAGTSIWYFAERVMEERGVPLEIDRQPLPASLLAGLGPDTPRRLPLDSLLVRAQEAVPGLRIQHVWLPESPEMPLFVRGQATALLVRERGNGVELDPYTGSVLRRYRAEELSTLQRWVQTADQLHFGDFAGLASKVGWFLLGTILCALMATGAVIHTRRTVTALRVGDGGRGGKEPPRATEIAHTLGFRHAGGWRIPTLLLVTAVPVASYLLWWAPRLETPVPVTVLSPAQLGPWSASAYTDSPLPQDRVSSNYWHVRFCAGCMQEIRSAAVAYGGPKGPSADPVRLVGSPNQLGALISAADGSEAESSRLWLIAEGWDGRLYQASWALR